MLCGPEHAGSVALQHVGAQVPSRDCSLHGESGLSPAGSPGSPLVGCLIC